MLTTATDAAVRITVYVPFFTGKRSVPSPSNFAPVAEDRQLAARESTW